MLNKVLTGVKRGCELIGACLYAAEMYVLRRHQHQSMKLRKLFSDKYCIDVGLYSYGCFDHWRMPGPMTVGRYCSIAGTVRSTRSNHPMEALTTYPALYDGKFGASKLSDRVVEPLIIEDDVWIGHNAILLSGCKFIGRGAVIGAGAIVTKDVEPYTIVVGNPARKIRDRFEPALREAIEASRWWRLDLEQLEKLSLRQPELVYRPSPSNLTQWLKRNQE